MTLPATTIGGSASFQRSPVTMRVMSRTAPVPSLPPLLISRYGSPGLRFGTSSNHG